MSFQQLLICFWSSKPNPPSLNKQVYVNKFRKDIIHKCGEASPGFPMRFSFKKIVIMTIYVGFVIVSSLITKVAHSHVGIPSFGVQFPNVIASSFTLPLISLMVLVSCLVGPLWFVVVIYVMLIRIVGLTTKMQYPYVGSPFHVNNFLLPPMITFHYYKCTIYEVTM